MKVINWIALILVIIGALNWGMVGFFQVDVIGGIFGGTNTTGARVIYALVGLAGLWSFGFFRWLYWCGCYKNWKDGVCRTHPCDDDHRDMGDRPNRNNGGCCR